MFYIGIIKYILLIFSSITIANYVIFRNAEAKKIIASTIIIFLYSFYFSSFLSFVLFFHWYIKEVFAWILVSIIINREEGIKNSFLAGIFGFIIFFFISLLF